ncbi:MAG: APC family permease [Pirellulaceae bacterium]|nr:APC family permease [Pirellulaceae bacterium]
MNEPSQPAGDSGPASLSDTPPAGSESVVLPGDAAVPPEEPSIQDKVKTLLVGKPLDLGDKRVYQHLALAAFFAWVGLGADGLSSSAYGPAEAFEHLERHSYLAIFLALATMFTVVVISACYSHIIEAFPSGGGGYLVASKMLGKQVGALAGCALIVDYVLTVTVSIAAAGDALFGLIGLVDPQWQNFKVWCETAAILFLVVLNLRGVKESITVLMPIFIVFLVTHAILIGGVLGLHVTEAPKLASDVSEHLRTDLNDPAIGWLLVIGMFLRAYSLGAGTYTGIEAVSNSMAVMREPRVATAKRTMLYMAVSLAITAGGLMLAYLFYDLELRDVGTNLMPPEPAEVAKSPDESIPLTRTNLPELRKHTRRTMNELVVSWFSERTFPPWLAPLFRSITVLSEATLLLVAAQAGFIGGPKCLANMAHDSWVPHWFGSLSERLASHNGIMLIGFSAIAALWATNGQVSQLVIMYSINVFLTFTLSMIGMTLHWYHHRDKSPIWRRRVALFAFGTVMCGAILIVTVSYKFVEGAWITVLVTGAVWGITLLVRRYYTTVTARLKGLDESLGTIEIKGEPNLAPPNPDFPTAVILVGGYSGLGVHTLLNSVRFMPNHFKNIIFISVGVVDSGNFKGAEEVEHLKKHAESALEKYVDLARRLGFASRAYMAIGADVVEELEQLCRVVHRDFPTSVVFAGQLVFQRETWYGMLLHNQTAYSLQRRLQWDGIPMVILPTRVRGA